MIVACPKCAAAYRLKREQIGPSGTQLRCATCQHVYTVTFDATQHATASEPTPVSDADDDTIALDIDADPATPGQRPVPPPLPPPLPGQTLKKAPAPHSDVTAIGPGSSFPAVSPSSASVDDHEALEIDVGSSPKSAGVIAANTSIPKPRATPNGGGGDADDTDALALDLEPTEVSSFPVDEASSVSTDTNITAVDMSLDLDLPPPTRGRGDADLASIGSATGPSEFASGVPGTMDPDALALDTERPLPSSPSVPLASPKEPASSDDGPGLGFGTPTLADATAEQVGGDPAPPSIGDPFAAFDEQSNDWQGSDGVGSALGQVGVFELDDGAPPSPAPASTPSSSAVDDVFEGSGGMVDLDSLPELQADSVPAGIQSPDPIGPTSATGVVSKGGAMSEAATDDIGPALYPRAEEIRPASLAPMERMQRASPQAEQRDERSERVGFVLNVVLTVAALFLFVVGALYFAGGHNVSIVSFIKHGGLHPAARSPPEGFMGVKVVWMRSLLYPACDGASLLVMTGEAHNTSDEQRRDLYAVTEVKNRAGEVVASSRAPVGIQLHPQDLCALTDSDSLDAAFRGYAQATDSQLIAPGATAPFTAVVLEPPPRGVRDLLHTVRLEQGKSLVEVPQHQALSVPDPQSEVDPPTNAQKPDVTVDDATKGRIKKRGRRLKRRRVRRRPRRGE